MFSKANLPAGIHSRCIPAAFWETLIILLDSAEIGKPAASKIIAQSLSRWHRGERELFQDQQESPGKSGAGGGKSGLASCNGSPGPDAVIVSYSPTSYGKPWALR